MTLRKRLFWLFSLLLMLVLLVVATLGHRLFLARLDASDHQSLDKASTQLQHILETQAGSLLGRLDGYAVRLTLADPPPAALPGGLDFILRINAQHQVETLMSRLPDAEWAALRQALDIPDQPPDAAHTRLEWLNEQPLNLFSVPLPDGEGQLLAGRRLQAEQLSGRVLFPGIQLHFLAPLATPTADEPNAEPLTAIRQQHATVVSGDEHLQTELHLHTRESRHGIRLQVSLPRLAYLNGLRAFNQFIVWTLVTAAGALVLAWFCLEFSLLRRVRFMQREIASIGLNARAARLTQLGDDELGRLGQAVNRMLDRLDNSEARDRAILDAIDDGYFEIEVGGRILTVNRGLEQQLGFTSDDLLGRNLRQFVDYEELERLRQQLRQTIADKLTPRFTVPIRRRNGTLGYFETQVTLIHDADGHYRGVRGILRDIGEQMAFQEQLYDMAHRDPLTGLGNRMAFTGQLQHHWDDCERTGRPLALLYLDLDRFKEVNDRFGHATGDALLSAIAERMHAAVRQPDLLYRLGGDEFTMLLPDTDLDKAVGIAQRLRAALAQPYDLAGQRIDFVLPSIGIALSPLHANSPDALINAADEAMYQAKLDGLGHCISQARPVSC